MHEADNRPLMRKLWAARRQVIVTRDAIEFFLRAIDPDETYRNEVEPELRVIPGGADVRVNLAYLLDDAQFRLSNANGLLLDVDRGVSSLLDELDGLPGEAAELRGDGANGGAGADTGAERGGQDLLAEKPAE